MGIAQRRRQGFKLHAVCDKNGVFHSFDFSPSNVHGNDERDEMVPSIGAAKKLAKILETSVGYLLGENDEVNLFKDPKMLQRFQDISVLPEKEKQCLLTTVDHFIKASRISMI